MIHGITVRLYNTQELERDGFNNPKEELAVWEDVKNVLVYPSTPDDIVDSTNLYGKRAMYTLGIPKGDEHLWTDQIVYFFGEYWKIYSFPIKGIDANIPLSWNDKYYCERYGIHNEM